MAVFPPARRIGMNDSESAPDHWQHFRRLMRWTALTAAISVVAAIAALILGGAPIRLHMLIAVALGIGLSIMLAGALMGLVFVSARSGHDGDAYTPPPGFD
jgi:cation transporter-like permease